MGWVGEGWGVGRVIWVVCALVWGIGLRRLGCGCGRRLVTGSCVICETTPTGRPRSSPRAIYLSIYPPRPARGWRSDGRRGVWAAPLGLPDPLLPSCLPIVTTEACKPCIPCLAPTKCPPDPSHQASRQRNEGCTALRLHGNSFRGRPCWLRPSL